jgi:hypothetical protein
MLRSLKRFIQTHFGGKQDLESVQHYTSNGNLWFGRNPEYAVVSYRGKTWAWDIEGLMGSRGDGEISAMMAELISFVLANESKPVMKLLYELTSEDFQHIQRKGNVIQDGSLSSESIHKLGEVK